MSAPTPPQLTDEERALVDAIVRFLLSAEQKKQAGNAAPPVPRAA